MNPIFIKLKNLWTVLLLILLCSPVSGQWIPKNGMAMTSNCFMIHYENHALYIGMTDVLFTTPDDGVTWNYMSPGITVLTMTRNNNIIFASDGGVAIVKSTDGGNHWSDVSGNLPPSVNIQCFCYNGPVLFMASYDQGVFKSEDNGATWTHVSSGLPSNGGVYAVINDLVAFNSLLFAATTEGLYKSSDNGTTWTIASTGLPLMAKSGIAREISSLAVNGNHLFSTPINGGVYTSTDNGTTWTKSGMGNWNCKVYVCDTDLFVCTTGYGLYQSINNGSVWNYLGLQSENAVQAGSAGSVI